MGMVEERNERLAIVEKLNFELMENAPSWMAGMGIEYRTNGYGEVIEGFGAVLWSSEHDDRGWIEVDGEDSEHKEDLEIFLRRKISEMIRYLASVEEKYQASQKSKSNRNFVFMGFNYPLATRPEYGFDGFVEMIPISGGKRCIVVANSLDNPRTGIPWTGTATLEEREDYDEIPEYYKAKYAKEETS